MLVPPEKGTVFRASEQSSSEDAAEEEWKLGFV
jgi:hypothetical protein